MRVKKGENNKNKHPLNSGIPCIIHQCVKCCIETEMELTRSDIERIKKLGYKLKDFTVKNGRDHYLKNHNGKCVFLRDNRCVIYSYRPEGCRLYPLIFDEDSGKAALHEFCPYRHEFKVSREDIENLHAVIKKLIEEQKF